jgi:Uri superfamily endonuclease
MRTKLALVLAVCVGLIFSATLVAQDLGPNFRKIKDGIYVYVGTNFNRCGLIPRSLLRYSGSYEPIYP